MIHNLDNHDHPATLTPDDCVQKSPEAWKVLDIQVLQIVLLLKAARNRRLPHDLPVEAVYKKDGSEGPGSAHY